MILHNPENPHPILVIYCWLSEDEKGNQGIIANPFPLLTSELALAEKMRPIAEEGCRLANLKAKLVKFVREN